MDIKDLAMGTVFLLQSTVGILGNVSLLSSYLILYYTGQTFKTTDLILTNLFTANSLIILSKGSLHTAEALGMEGFFNDVSCKLLLYVQRLGRSVSIGTTCLLSVFQAITISPANSCWQDIKIKAPKYIGLSTSLCWILYLILNMIFPLYGYTKGNRKNITCRSDLRYCSTVEHDDFTGSLYTALFVFPEILISVLIIWSSSFMVVILYRHKQRARLIHSINFSSRTSPESRATQSILVLVSTFLGFYAISSILQDLIALVYNPGRLLVEITAFISMCFPTLGPFVMSRDAIVPILCFARARNPEIPQSYHRCEDCLVSCPQHLDSTFLLSFKTSTCNTGHDHLSY